MQTMVEISTAAEEQRASLARARVLVPVEGAMFLLLGAVAIVLPGLAAIAVTVLLGWIFVFSGLIGLMVALGARHAPGHRWSIVSAVVALAAGLALMIWPIEDVASLMLVLGLFLAADGIFSVMYAFDHRRELSGRWVWMLASGIFTLAFAAAILAKFPMDAALLGTLVGIDLLIAGAALVAVGTGLKNPV
jgi:uncharacterized membrane protein HdeD (DUF308 family)